jgi:hypothetical protein
MVIDLLYDSYTFCFHHLLKKNKVDRMSRAWNLKLKKGRDEFEEEEASNIEENLNIYVMNACRILQFILDTLKENGIENQDRQRVIELMKTVLTDPTTEVTKWVAPGIDVSKGNEETNKEHLVSSIDLSLIYEYFNEDHWLKSTSIIHFLQLRFLSIDDPLFAPTSFREQISPEVLLEKVSYLSVCLYAMSTETRYIDNKDQTQQKKVAVIHKETTEITPRFQNFNLSEKKIDLGVEEFRSTRMGKLKLKEKQVNKEVTES